MNKDNTELKTQPIPQLMLKYSIPAIIAMVVNALYNVVDRIFIGNIPDVGALAIVGVGVTFPITQIINSFGMLVAIGGATSISIKMGQQKKEEAEKILGNVVVLAGIFGILLTILGTVYSDQIIMAFGASPESLPFAQDYISIILLGAVFCIFGITFNSLIRGDGNPKLSGKIMIVSCLLNASLDAVFIMGMDMGIQGAAMATVIAQIVAVVMGIFYYCSGKSRLKLDIKNCKLEIPYAKQIFMIGLAPFFTSISGSVTQVISNNLLQEHGGDLAIGAMATVMTVMIMFGMPVVGITTGMQPIISYNFGAKEYGRVKEVIKLASVVVTSLLVLSWIMILVFPEVIAGIFNNDPDLISITVSGMKKYLLFFPLMGITYVGTNFIQSTGQAKVAMVLSLLRQFIFLIPLLLLLPKYFGLDGIWYTQPISDVLSCTITVLVMVHTLRKYTNVQENVADEVAVVD